MALPYIKREQKIVLCLRTIHSNYDHIWKLFDNCSLQHLLASDRISRESKNIYYLFNFNFITTELFILNWNDFHSIIDFFFSGQLFIITLMSADDIFVLNQIDTSKVLVFRLIWWMDAVHFEKYCGLHSMLTFRALISLSFCKRIAIIYMMIFCWIIFKK